MKKLLFSLAAIALSATATFAQAKADEIAKFKTETIDQGKLQIDNPVTATFVVTNIGTKDLIIESANPTCGCTIGDYTKTPIKPGQTGTVTAQYNAKGLGAFDKHMTVKFAGADDMKSITIKGEVLNAEDYAKFKGTAAPATLAATPAAATKDANKKTLAAATPQGKTAKKKACKKC